MKLRILSSAIILLFSAAAHSFTETDYNDAIKKASEAIERLEKDENNKPYIPYGIYADLVVSIRAARSSFGNGNIDEAYFHARAAIEYAETVAIIADTRRMVKEIEIANAISKIETRIAESEASRYSLLLASGFRKKGNCYTVDISDGLIFGKNRGALSGSGEERLNKLVQIIKKLGPSGVVIVGHTSKRDVKNYSARKAGIVESFLIKQGVDSGLIRKASFGDTVAADTAAGFIKADRIEIVLEGLQ